MGYTTYTCPSARTCGGCEWLAVPYPLQLRRKYEQVRELFSDILEADGATLTDIAGVSGKPLAYRHKAATPFAPGPRRSIRSGLYAQGSHRIVPCATCLVEDPRARAILNEVAHIATRLHISAYNEDTGRGVLRHAIIRTGWKTDEILLTIVTHGRDFHAAHEFIRTLHHACPTITSCVQNVNTRKTNAMLGHESHILWGSGVMHDELLGCRFEIGPTSFYQTNPAQTERLYQLALEAADLSHSDLVLDAYCGTGTIGICAAAAARRQENELRVIGIESVADAVACAKRNACANGVGDACRFYAGDASRWIQQRAADLDHLDVVIMDPPRAGSTPAFLHRVCMLAASRIVYVSCDIRTQARDIRFLRDGGYRLVQLSPVDMFPHTKHVETVALLSRT